MEIVVLLLRQNLVMLVYMMIGYFLYKKKLVSAGGSADIGRILLHIIMPAAILKSYLADFSRERLEGLFVSFLAALLSLLLSIAAARIAFSRTGNRTVRSRIFQRRVHRDSAGTDDPGGRGGILCLFLCCAAEHPAVDIRTGHDHG